MLILGLDVSTSVVGVCVLDTKFLGAFDAKNITVLDKIDFKKCKTLWEKADRVNNYFGDMKLKLDHVFVEDAAMRYSPGMSSAQTIATLLRFNGLVSYAARNMFGVDPTFITPSAARKLIGLKMQRVSKCGKSHKMQVFEQLAQSDLSAVTWPLKKSGKIQDWSYDATDAFVIAKAGCMIVQSSQPSITIST